MKNPYKQNPQNYSRRPIEAVKGILATVLKKQNLEEKLAKYDFVLHWADIVGPEIAKRTRPECIKQGVMIVAVNNSVWAQELSFNKPMILKKLRERINLGEKNKVLRDIQFYVTKEIS